MGKGKRNRLREQMAKREAHAANATGSARGPGMVLLMLLALALVTFTVYSNTLKGPFLFDSLLHIQNDPNMHLRELTIHGLKNAAFQGGMRPVSRISLALNYYFDRNNVAGYRLINILIHFTTGMLLFFLVRMTLGLPPLRDRYDQTRWIPFLTVLIWLVHPLQIQSVTYVIQRENSMAAMFFLLSILLYARARLARAATKKRMLFAGCVLAGLLALGSKQNAATLPFFIFLYEWYFFQDLKWAWIRRHALVFACLLAAIAILAFLVLQTALWQKVMGLYHVKDFTLKERLLTEARVMFFYLSLILFPHPSRLTIIHDFRLSHSILNPPTTPFAIAAIAALLLIAVLRAKRYRLLSFCILWFFGNLVIESTVIPLALIYEHRLYLPSMAPCLMAVIFGYRYLKPSWARIGAACLVVALFSVWTYQRNGVWTNDLVFWRDAVSKAPNKETPHLNLGVALRERGNIAESTKEFYEAMRLDPKDPDAPYNLAVTLKKEGKVDEAISYYRKALKLNPDFVDAHNNLGIALESQGKYAEAVVQHREALRIVPNYARAHNSLGVALQMQGKLDEAIQHYKRALQIDPDYAKAYYNLAGAYMAQGKLDEAIADYYESLRINPGYGKAHYNLGVALYQKGKTREAVSQFDEALRINPNDALARRALQLLSR